MADIGGLRRLVLGIPDPATRSIMVQFVEQAFGNLTFGAVDPTNKKATNFQMYHQPSTTATSTSEFTIVHNMDRAPQIAIPVLDLSQPGAKIVPLEVTRAADSRRIYVKTPAGSTNAVFSLLVE
jgi:hypothetical protein